MNALVSAVIPTYNYGRFVCAAVDSALAQTYQPLEIIVVDDGSTDDTRERLSRYGDRIRYIYQQNKHLSAARNTGIAAARGQYIALLDSDDVWAPQKIAAQMELFTRFPEAGLVATARFNIDPDNRRLGESGIESSPTGYVELTVRDLLEYSAFAPSAALIRKVCLDAVGPFDETLRSVEDLDMWLRLAQRYRVLKLTAPLTGFRVHPGSMSTHAEPMLRNHLKVLDKVFAGAEDGRLRRLAEARLYREVAWMRYTSGDARGAVRDLWRSVRLWPWALRNKEGRRARGQRAKMLATYTVAALRRRASPER
jgi:glycosyltransferase involved in cell wall biosynthesis